MTHLGDGTFSSSKTLDQWERVIGSPDTPSQLADELTNSNVGHAFNFDANFYSVVFVSKRMKKDGELVRIMLHRASDRGQAPTWFDATSTTILGKREMYEIFLHIEPGATIESKYELKPEPNPVETQAIKFAKAVFVRAAALPTQKIQMRLYHVSLPLPRATVTAKSRVTLPAAATDPITDVVALGAELRRTHRISECASQLATVLEKIVIENVRIDSPDTLAQKLRRAATTHVETPQCMKEVEPGAVDAAARAQAVNIVTDKFLAFPPEAAPAVVEGEATFQNVPLTHWTFGLGAAAMASIAGDDRVKASDDGKFVSDPLEGSLTMASVHFHPNAFDSTSIRPSEAERFSITGSVVLTPVTGIGIGAGYALFRGLSLEAGMTWLRVSKLPDDAKLNDTITEDKPLERGIARVIYLGIGYAFD